jgi:prepilin-type N-terminal cleavage/methylation domain-containing protein/prepilin-type processing-associated H-X9-DG protein
MRKLLEPPPRREKTEPQAYSLPPHMTAQPVSHAVLIDTAVHFTKILPDAFPNHGEPMRTPTQRTRRRGYSLIELLVVMAIMASLAAMGMGGYQKARAVAGRIACVNNLRQLYLGLESYAGANQDQFPEIANLAEFNSTGLPTLRELLGDKNDATGHMFHCPLDAKYFPKEGNSYEYNNRRLAKKTREQAQARRRSTTSSEKVTVLWDFTSVHGPEFSGKGRNFLYLDGHVSN